MKAYVPLVQILDLSCMLSTETHLSRLKMFSVAQDTRPLHMLALKTSGSLEHMLGPASGFTQPASIKVEVS